MTRLKVVLCVLGAVALLDVAGAKTMHGLKPLSGSRRAAASSAGRGPSPESIRRASKQVGDLLRHLGKQQGARRLQSNHTNHTNHTTGGGGGGGTPPETTLTMYVHSELGTPSCDREMSMPVEVHNIQQFVDSQMCVPSDDGSNSTTWSFDGRSLILRTFTYSSNCRGSRTVMTFPCGCHMGFAVEGLLCANVPPPAGHVTHDFERPGLCVPSPEASVLRVPIWEGCYHAPNMISQRTIDAVLNRSTDSMTEVYAHVYSTGDGQSAVRMVYSIHDDMHCTSPPHEVFSLSCECTRSEEEMVWDGFEPIAFHLTGDFCTNVRKPDVRMYEFPPQPVPCGWPQWKASLWLNVCTPAQCSLLNDTSAMPCEDLYSVMARPLGDAEHKAVVFTEYPGAFCTGQPIEEFTVSCGECATSPWSEADYWSYVKVLGPHCNSGHGGQCTGVPRSLVPPEMEATLMPCTDTQPGGFSM